MSRLTSEERAFLWRAIDKAHLTANVDELIKDALAGAAWQVQREINHASAVPFEQRSQRFAWISDLKMCRDRIVQEYKARGETAGLV